MTLIPEIKAQWLEALRSKKYKQGSGTLRGLSNNFCCLGVLCDILPQSMGRWQVSSHDLWVYDDYEEAGGGLVPMALADKIGLSGGQQDMLSYMNDEGKKSFLEIADYIEKYL